MKASLKGNPKIKGRVALPHGSGGNLNKAYATPKGAPSHGVVEKTATNHPVVAAHNKAWSNIKAHNHPLDQRGDGLLEHVNKARYSNTNV